MDGGYFLIHHVNLVQFGQPILDLPRRRWVPNRRDQAADVGHVLIQGSWASWRVRV